MANPRKSALRKWIAGVLSAFLLALPFFLIFAVAGEIYFRRKASDFFPRFQKCLGFDSRLRHGYRPNCQSTEETPQGTVAYSFNEDGLRDRPKKEFEGRKVIAVLGDSVVKGVFLNDADTIPSRLEKRLSGEMGALFLNAGIRFASPTLEFLRYQKLVEPRYGVQGVLLIVNGGDANDEKFFRAEAADSDGTGFPERFNAATENLTLPSQLISTLNAWNKGRSNFFDILLKYLRIRTYRGAIRDIPSTRENLCGGIDRIAAHLKRRKVPLLIVFSPHYIQGIEMNWAGEPFAPADLTMMVKCARETGATVVDLSSERLERKWFLEDLIHYSPEGVDWFVNAIAPEVAKTLRPKK